MPFATCDPPQMPGDGGADLGADPQCLIVNADDRASPLESRRPASHIPFRRQLPPTISAHRQISYRVRGPILFSFLADGRRSRKSRATSHSDATGATAGIRATRHRQVDLSCAAKSAESIRANCSNSRRIRIDNLYGGERSDWPGSPTCDSRTPATPRSRSIIDADAQDGGSQCPRRKTKNSSRRATQPFPLVTSKR